MESTLEKLDFENGGNETGHQSYQIVHLVGNKRAYVQSGYPKEWSNGQMITKDYFGFLLHLLFHNYRGLVYDYT
jgi:hypothetical protein